MKTYFRINIPDTMRMYLNEDAIEYLTHIGIRHTLSVSDVEDYYTSLYPTRRRAVRALIKYIDEQSIDEFYENLSEVRTEHVRGDCYRLRVCSTRKSVLVHKD